MFSRLKALFYAAPPVPPIEEPFSYLCDSETKIGDRSVTVYKDCYQEFQSLQFRRSDVPLRISKVTKYDDDRDEISIVDVNTEANKWGVSSFNALRYLYLGGLYGTSPELVFNKWGFNFKCAEKVEAFVKLHGSDESPEMQRSLVTTLGYFACTKENDPLPSEAYKQLGGERPKGSTI